MPYWYEKDQELIPDDGETYLTTNQAAELLNLHPGTLAHWRSRDIGPRFHKLGRIVRYRRTDVDRFAEGYED